MALPTTNITISAVKDEIGETTYALGELRTSPLTNQWGFVAPYVSDIHWGKVPTINFHLGDFRGYIHTWRAWSIDGIVNTSPQYIEDGSSFNLSLDWFPGWSAADSATHAFSIEFKRTDDYNQSPGSYITTYATMTNQSFRNFSFSNTSPPDGGSALSLGQVVYIRVKHLSSPDRKWDEDRALTYGGDEATGYVFPLTVPDENRPVNHVNIASISSQVYNNGTIIGSNITTGISSNGISTVTAWYSVQIALDTAFTQKVTGWTGSVSISSGTVYDTINDTGLSTSYSVGTTYYARARITNVSSGNYTTSWFPTQTFIVIDDLPM